MQPRTCYHYIAKLSFSALALPWGRGDHAVVGEESRLNPSWNPSQDASSVAFGDSFSCVACNAREALCYKLSFSALAFPLEGKVAAVRLTDEM